MIILRQSSSSDLRFSSQSGQVGVIVLLIMVVLLTVGLSLATRSTQDLFLSQQQSESARVFNAAEAGIEEALSSSFTFQGDVSSGTLNSISDADVNYTVTKRNILETRLFEGIAVMVDVTGVTTGQGVRIDWSKESDCTNENVASVIADVYYSSGATTKVRHLAYAGCSKSDGFSTATNINSDGYRRQVTIPLQTNDLFVRLRSVYNDTHVRVVGNGWTLPVQYYNIRSEAQSQLGNETRIVEVNRTLSAAPTVLDFAIFSGTSINKD